jgi:putative GTP pyrophosphokinase
MDRAEIDIKIPNQNDLRLKYEHFSEACSLIALDLQNRIEEALSDLSSRPLVKRRLKDFDSYFKKYVKISKSTPEGKIPVITDLIGIRIVCPFIEDLGLAADILKKNFEVTEIEQKGSNYSFKEFGYESTHLLIKIPHDIISGRGNAAVEVAEVQIRTILQDAWAEVEHELVYKAEFTPFDDPMKRKLAAVNASLSLADTIFQEIRSYQRQLNGELGKRRESFFKKIEESVDALLFTGEAYEKQAEDTDRKVELSGFTGGTIDDLLLNALFAHNKGLFAEAIAFYSYILELKPDETIQSLIFKHRGMAYFAQSKYQEAIADFTGALARDRESYKAVYYRGVVYSVLRQYSQAIDDFTLSLKINPYQPFCLFRRGQAYFHLADYPKALGDAEDALSLDPRSEPLKKFRELVRGKLKM